jgi:Ca2+-transporting ATPase
MPGAALSNPPDLPAWHALPAHEVLARLDSYPGGLTDREAGTRLARYGRNLFQRSPPASAWSVLLAQLRSVVVALLVAAAAVAVATGDRADAAAIGAVLILNIGIGFVTELRAHRAMEALLGLEVSRATVMRDGHAREIDAAALVPGDVLVLEAGGSVPADARLLEAVELRTTEASLTGESVPVDKRADTALPAETPLPERATMVYKATTAVAGRGTAIVVATGMATEVGRIGALTARVKEERTPLERRLDALGRRLAAVAVAVSVLVAALGYFQGLPISEILQTAIALAVAAVPEGLPVVGTIAMAVGMRRMARRRALVRHLPVVDTLGSATVICTDKTGTLTTGEMTATVLRLAEREEAIPSEPFAPAGDAEVALRVAALANRGEVTRSAEGWVGRGDPTETALLVAALKAGLDPASLRRDWPEVGDVPFSSERMYMATFHRRHGSVVACVKGAPARVLPLCARMQVGDTTRELGREDRVRLLTLNRQLAAKGLRVLALATGQAASPGESALRELTWVGYVGMLDPPAPGVGETIRTFQQAGIRTVMLTGDQRLTGETVARELGLLRDGEGVMEGQEVDRLTDGELVPAVASTAVFSRVSPEGKLRIVAAHQARGEVVAMLGDGVNDAAALRKADIGVVMGGRGTDLAKEAADLTLEDDRFPTIAAAVEQGRVIFDNIRKFVFYLFSCNLAEILVVLGGSLAGFPAVLLPLQILWLNLLTDTFPALALAVEPGEPDVMRQPPRDPRAAILSGSMLRSTLLYGGLIAACSLGAFAWALTGDGDRPARASTLTFLTLAFAQIFHLGNARSSGAVLSWARITANPFALGAVVLACALQALAVYYGPLAAALEIEMPRPDEWLVVVLLALVPAVLGQGARLFRVGFMPRSSKDRYTSGGPRIGGA